MKFIAIIPARYASTRFPGKPLVSINGKPMIQLVYEQCLKVFDLVVVATDDERIQQAVKAFGGMVVMTSIDHTSGTDRIAEAVKIIANDYSFDVVVNVQGDEPFIQPVQLQQLCDCFDEPTVDIATLITPINDRDTLFDVNKVKAVVSTNNNAMVFSRQAIPCMRDLDKELWHQHHQYYLHLGLYAYRKEVLLAITKLQPTPLEKAEKLEQLRWLENGYKIATAITYHQSIGIDTPDDLEKVKLMK